LSKIIFKAVSELSAGQNTILWQMKEVRRIKWSEKRIPKMLQNGIQNASKKTIPFVKWSAVYMVRLSKFNIFCSKWSYMVSAGNSDPVEQNGP